MLVRCYGSIDVPVWLMSDLADKVGCFPTGRRLAALAWVMCLAAGSAYILSTARELTYKKAADFVVHSYRRTAHHPA